MDRIKRVSLIFRLLFQFSFIALPVLLAIFWVYAPGELGWPQHGFGVGFYPQSIEVMHPLSVTTRLLGFLISLIPYGLIELSLFYLIRLFRLYEKAEIFSVNSVSYIKKIGYTLLVSQLLNPLYWALITFDLTWGNGHGHRYIAITIDGTNIGIVIVSFIIILISWVMAEGSKLRDELQLTI